MPVTLRRRAKKKKGGRGGGQLYKCINSLERERGGGGEWKEWWGLKMRRIRTGNLFIYLVALDQNPSCDKKRGGMMEGGGFSR